MAFFNAEDRQTWLLPCTNCSSSPPSRKHLERIEPAHEGFTEEDAVPSKLFHQNRAPNLILKLRSPALPIAENRAAI